MITRIALYITLGLALSGLAGLTLSSIGFWAILALFAVADRLSYFVGVQDGAMMALELPQVKIDELKKQIDRIKGKS